MSLFVRQDARLNLGLLACGVRVLRYEIAINGRHKDILFMERSSFLKERRIPLCFTIWVMKDRISSNMNKARLENRHKKSRKTK